MIPTWYCSSCKQAFALGEAAFELFNPMSPAYCPKCETGTELDVWDEDQYGLPTLEELRRTSTPVTDIDEAVG